MAEAMQKLAYRLAISIMVPLILAAPFVVSRTVEAADFTSRRLHMSDSRASVTASHEISMDFVTAALIGSIQIEYCTNSPLLNDACIAPTGIDLTTAIFASESGETGFSVHANSDANTWVLTRPASVVVPQNSTYLFTGVVNPGTVGSHFVRLSAYASSDASGGRIDEGGIAIAITQPVTIGAFVPPILLFCLGVSIPTNDCSSATGDNIDFGDFTDSATSFGSTQMLAATNGFGGYSIAVTGTTMTSGNNVIPGPASPVASVAGTSQFGMNLVDNSTPNIGVNVSGVGTGAATNSYNNPNAYMFRPGDVVASSSSSSDINRFTTSYIVNVADSQRPGIYATTLTYIATASF